MSDEKNSIDKHMPVRERERAYQNLRSDCLLDEETAK